MRIEKSAFARADASQALPAFVFIAFAAIALATPDAVRAAVAPDVEDLETPLGVPVRFAAMPDSERVAIHVVWPSDWAYGDEAVGAPRIGTRLMGAGGTETLSAAELAAAFEDLAAESALEPTVDEVVGALVTDVSDLDRAIELAADVIARPTLDERWFERVRDEYVASVREIRQLPGARAAALVTRAALGDAPPVPSMVDDDVEAIEATTLEDVRRWHARTFVRSSGLRVVVAGGIDRDGAVRAVDALLGALPEGRAVAAPPDVPIDGPGRPIVLADPALETSRFVVAGPLPTLDGGSGGGGGGGEFEDLAALSLLSGGEDSALYEAIRTELRATYGIDASAERETATLRPLALFGEIDTERLGEARALLLETYAAFVEDGPDFAALDSRKRAYRASLIEAFGQPGAVAGMLLGSLLEGSPPERIERLVDELDAVTPASITTRIENHWPAVDELVEVYLTPDPAPFADTDACVIERMSELARCR